MLRVKEIADDFYVNVNLNTEMDLPKGRESVMHYFEQLQKRYPSMKNFYSRERGEFVLEEDKDKGYYRWASVENRRICTGYVNPTNYDDAILQHEYVLEQLPYTLSVSPLECESLNFMFGFDFTYRGNHNDLVAEALGVMPGFEALTNWRERNSLVLIQRSNSLWTKIAGRNVESLWSPGQAPSTLERENFLKNN